MAKYELPGYDWKRVSLTREGEGGGNFPDLESALQDLEKKIAGGYMPDSSDPYEIILGPGEHSYTRSVPIALPDGIIIRGSGAAATKITGTYGNWVTQTVTNATWSGGVATITTSGTHGWSVGDSVLISGLTGGFWSFIFGNKTITFVTATTFGFVQGSDPGVYAGGGTAFVRPTSIFQLGEGVISDLSFVNCDIAIERVSGGTLLRLNNVFATSVGTLLKGYTSGITIAENCNMSIAQGTQFINNGGSIFAVLSCFFNVPNTGTSVPLVQHLAGRFAMRDCVFDGANVGGQTGFALEIDFAEGGFGLNECELVSNDFYNLQSAIEIRDNTGDIYSQSDSVINCVSGVTFETGYTGTARIAGMQADVSAFNFNGYIPEQCTVLDYSTGRIHTVKDIILEGRQTMLKTARFRRGF